MLLAVSLGPILRQEVECKVLGDGLSLGVSGGCSLLGCKTHSDHKGHHLAARKCDFLTSCWDLLGFQCFPWTYECTSKL